MKFSLRLTFAIVVLLLVSSCAKPRPDQIYRGTYFYNFESSSFTPEGTNESWCLSGDLRKAELPARGPGDPWGSAYVVVRGELGSPGHYCNMGASKYVLTVHDVIEVRDRVARDL